MREVGPGKAYARIEDALAVARPGDTIRVHPLPGDRAYERVALKIRTPRLAVVGVSGPRRPRIDGAGFDYSGAGSVPRAVFQFDPEAAGGRVENLEIFGAHNASHNGAAVRINAADSVTIRGCHIHGNDMGIMSGGDARTARNQRIENCRIHHNGDPTDPGYNHNLYLGGASAFLVGCEISHATTGHNLKSRARFTRVEACWIHDAANREVDLVDAKDTTDRPGSDALLLGCIVAKDPRCAGNRGVVHFGQDGGAGRDGTLHLVHCTIVTPFAAPLILLTTPTAAARLDNCLLHDGGSGQRGQVLVEGGPALGAGNALYGGWNPAGLASLVAPSGVRHPLRDPAAGDCRVSGAPRGVPWSRIRIADGEGGAAPLRALSRFIPGPAAATRRTEPAGPTVGACGL